MTSPPFPTSVLPKTNTLSERLYKKTPPDPTGMSQRVPNWDVNDDAANATHPRLSFSGAAAAAAAAPTPPRPDLSSVDYEVAELTWENGQLSMHGLGHSRPNTKPPAAVGTLESLVNQATSVVDDVVPPAGRKPSFATADLAPWFDPSVAPTDVIATASTTMTMDVLVPCTAAMANDPHQHPLWLLAESVTNGTGVCGCCSTRVGSCSAMGGGNGEMNPVEEEQRQEGGRKRTHRGGGVEWGDHQSVSGSGVYNSHHITTQDTYEREPELENAASQGSTEDTSYRKGGGGRAAATATTEENDSVHSHPQREAEEKRRLGKSSLSTKRNRAAAIHNQSERKRRDKINQRMKTLQKLVPNSSKMDKASVLDEAIDYLKQLQAQVQMMSRMNMPVPPPMMLPLAMQQQQQQLQLSMMAPMGLGLGLPGMPNVMAGDITGLSGNRPNIPGIPPATAVLQPFMPMAVPWNGSPGDRFSSGPTAAGSPDPLSAFLVGQSPPGMTLEAYTRLAAMYQQQMRRRQQQQQQPPPQPSNPNN